MRKTIDVTKVLELANGKLNLLDNVYVTPAWRRGVASLLESILLETDTYAGFNYRAWQEWGYEAWKAAGKPEDKKPYFGDETKVEYFRHRRLEKKKEEEAVEAR